MTIIKKRLPETEGSAGKWRGQTERRVPDGNVWVPDPAIPELFSYMKQEICTLSPFFLLKPVSLGFCFLLG